jgi:hypothetical protein
MVKTQQGQQQLQTDLHSLERWATKWGVRFNVIGDTPDSTEHDDEDSHSTITLC